MKRTSTQKSQAWNVKEKWEDKEEQSEAVKKTERRREGGKEEDREHPVQVLSVTIAQ